MNIPKDVSGQSIYRKWWFWVIEVPFLLFVALLILRAPFYFANEKSKEVVAQIHAQKLTLADVNGENLPPQPDPTQVDATIEGVDANGNGIRDDVELAIFKKYPDSARIRSAELQYAKALQMELTEVFNSETLVATLQEESRTSSCIIETARTRGLPFKQFSDLSDKLDAETRALVLNTPNRKQHLEDVFRKYMTSYGGMKGEVCDIPIGTFPN